MDLKKKNPYYLIRDLSRLDQGWITRNGFWTESRPLHGVVTHVSGRLTITGSSCWHIVGPWLRKSTDINLCWLCWYHGGRFMAQNSGLTVTWKEHGLFLWHPFSTRQWPRQPFGRELKRGKWPWSSLANSPAKTQDPSPFPVPSTFPASFPVHGKGLT